jgi:dipeptidyl aminopeptidase/acylaminoacyl peptidase
LRPWLLADGCPRMPVAGRADIPEVTINFDNRALPTLRKNRNLPRHPQIHRLTGAACPQFNSRTCRSPLGLATIAPHGIAGCFPRTLPRQYAEARFETHTEDRRMIRFALPLLLVVAMTCLTPAQPAPGEAKAHSDLIHSIAFSPDGKTFATAGFDKAVKLWEFANGNMKELKTLNNHTDPVYCVAFNNDGKWLASSSLDKTIRIWNVADGKQLQEMKGHTDIVDAIAFSPDGKLLASASGMADKSVRLWNPADGKEIKNLGTHGGSVYAVAFSPDGKLLASAGSDNTIKIWDVPGQKEVTQLKGHEMGVTGVVFTDNNKLVSVSQDRTVRIWDLSIKVEPKKEEPKKEEPKKEPKKDEKKDAKDKKDPPKDKKDIPEPKKEIKDPREIMKFGPTPDDLYGVAWSKDAKSIVTAGYAGNISLWDLNDPKPKFAKKLKSLAYCIAFTPDGKTSLSGHLNGFVYATPLTGGK